MNYLFQDFDDDEALLNAIESSLEEFHANSIIPMLPDGIDEAALVDNPIACKALSLLKMVNENRKRLNDLISMDLGYSEEEDKAIDENEVNEQLINYDEMQNIDEYQKVIKKMADKLGDEPENGICIAIVMQEKNKRFQRNFNPSDLGKVVYIWAASQDDLINNGYKLGGFDLYGPITPLNPNTTLSEQHIANRTLCKVIRKIK